MVLRRNWIIVSWQCLPFPKQWTKQSPPNKPVTYISAFWRRPQINRSLELITDAIGWFPLADGQQILDVFDCVRYSWETLVNKTCHSLRQTSSSVLAGVCLTWQHSLVRVSLLPHRSLAQTWYSVYCCWRGGIMTDRQLAWLSALRTLSKLLF